MTRSDSDGVYIYTAELDCLERAKHEFSEGWHTCGHPLGTYLSCEMNRYKGQCPYGYALTRSIY
jgi:hypothetical protein